MPPSPLPPSLCPHRITLCGRHALCRTCIHQRRGQGATLEPLVLRAHLCPCRFEEPCCWPVGNRSGAGVRVGVQTPSCIFHETVIFSTLMHTYTHRMYRCCSFLPHLFLHRKNSRSKFSLRVPLPKFNSLAWRRCQIVSLEARFPMLFLWQRWAGAFWTMNYLSMQGSGAACPALVTPDSKSISRTLVNAPLICELTLRTTGCIFIYEAWVVCKQPGHNNYRQLVLCLFLVSQCKHERVSNGSICI